MSKNNKNNIYRIYVDGSYNAGLKVGAWAFVVVDDDKSQESCW